MNNSNRTDLLIKLVIVHSPPFKPWAMKKAFKAVLAMQEILTINFYLEVLHFQQVHKNIFWLPVFST